MPSDAEVLERIQLAFATCARPLHFTNHLHCCECADHDEVLRSRDINTLCITDVGNPGWDPICFISPEGFAYYMPALARLALLEPTEPQGWYVPQLLFHLCYDGRRNARMLACTTAQRRAVCGLLDQIFETRTGLVDTHFCADELLNAMECWSEESDAAING